MVTVEQKLLHDQLLELKPEDSSHDSLTCPICTPEGGVSMSDNFTQADLDAAVEEALKPLQDQINTLTASKEEVEIQARIDEATAGLTTEVDDLKAQLDVATVEASTSKETLTNALAYLEDVKTQGEALVALAAARDDRIAKIAEVAPTMPEDHVQANADRWALMPEEDFDAMIASFKVVTAANGTTPPATPPANTEIPSGTVMTASLDSKPSGDGLDLLRQSQQEFLLGRDNRNVRHV